LGHERPERGHREVQDRAVQRRGSGRHASSLERAGDAAARRRASLRGIPGRRSIGSKSPCSPESRPGEEMDLTARLCRWFERLPAWVRVAVGIVAVALGAVIVLRPTTSLGVLALLIGAGLVLAG